MKIKKQSNLHTIKQYIDDSQCINKHKLQAIKGGNDLIIIDDMDGL